MHSDVSLGVLAYLRMKHCGQETIGELHRRACEIFDLSMEQVNYVSQPLIVRMFYIDA